MGLFDFFRKKPSGVERYDSAIARQELKAARAERRKERNEAVEAARRDRETQEQIQNNQERVQHNITNQTRTIVNQQRSTSNSALDRAKRREARLKGDQIRSQLGYFPKHQRKWVGVVVTVILILAFFGAYSYGALPTTIQTGVQKVIQEITNPEVKEMIKKFFSRFSFGYLQKTVTDIGTWKSPQAKQLQTEEIGLSIENFEANRFFWEEQEIILRGEIVPKNLEGEFSATVSCELENYTGDSYISLLSSQKGNKEIITTFSEDDNNRPREFYCLFPQGIKIPLRELFGTKLEKEKEVSRTAYINITSEYEVETLLQFYTLGENKWDEYGSDPFGISGEKSKLSSEGLWGGEGYIISQQQNYGPMELALGMGGQPYTSRRGQEQGHTLIINLRDATLTIGELDELESISFRLPQFAKVNPDICPDFTRQGEGETWVLKREIIDQINNCGKKCGFDKNDLPFFCEIKVSVDDPNKDLKASWVTASAKYKYKTHKFTYVYVRPRIERDLEEN